MGVSEPRNGVVRYESVMMLRNKLEELGKMKGVNQDEKGGSVVIQSVLFLHKPINISLSTRLETKKPQVMSFTVP